MFYRYYLCHRDLQRFNVLVERAKMLWKSLSAVVVYRRAPRSNMLSARMELNECCIKFSKQNPIGELNL